MRLGDPKGPGTAPLATGLVQGKLWLPLPKGLLLPQPLAAGPEKPMSLLIAMFSW